MNEDIKTTEKTEETKYKKYTALKVVSLALITALTILLSYTFISVVNASNQADVGIGLAVFVTIYLFIIGISVSAVSEIFSIIGLILTIKNVPKGKNKGEIIWFSILILLPIFIECLFYILVYTA